VVTYYGGSPDYWNAKPPLSEWGSALGHELVSTPLLGVRLFSLVAAMLCCLVVFLYTRRIAGFGAGLLAAALLITARPLIVNHGARSADADMLFIGLVSLGMLGFDAANRRGIALGYIALGFAFLAKSFHVAPYGLVAVVFTVMLYRQQRLGLRDVLLLPFCGFIPVLPWALARYLADGWHFFHVMLFYDVVERSTEVIEGHQASHWLYLNRLFLAFGLLILLPLSLLLSRCRYRLQEPRVQLLLLWALLPLGIYSLAQSKLPWYIFPCFPALAVLIAVALQTWRSLLPKAGGMALAVVVVLTLGQNEAIIASHIIHNQIGDDPVAITMMALSAAAPHERVLVYLQDDMQPPEQGLYATSLLMGNIDLQQGGAASFAAAAGRVEDHVLIGPDGRLLGQPTAVH